MTDKSPQTHEKVGRSLKDKRVANKAKKSDHRVRAEPVRPAPPDRGPRTALLALPTHFPGDQTREPTPAPQWWLCDPCDQVLLAGRCRAA